MKNQCKGDSNQWKYEQPKCWIGCHPGEYRLSIHQTHRAQEDRANGYKYDAKGVRNQCQMRKLGGLNMALHVWDEQHDLLD